MPERGGLFLAAGLVAAGLLLAMWASALWVYDREKMADALAQHRALLAGESPFQWSFDSPAELGIAHDPDRFQWSGGRLRGAQNDPYFYLNLEGRRIDARRYGFLEIRIHSEGAGQLRLFHEQPGDPAIHASDLVDLAPGWQTLEVDLANAGWRTLGGAGPEPTYVASAWGNARGVVSALRIDPVRYGAFEVDWVKLKPAGGARPEFTGVETFRDLGDPLFDRMRAGEGRIWLVAQDRWARTPETAHLVRMKIAGEFPSTIVFPRPPAAAALAPGSPGRRPAPGMIPALAYALALLVLAGSRRLPASWRPLPEAAALLIAIEAAVFWAPHLPAHAGWLPGVPLLAVIWAWRPAAPWGALLGNARAWLAVAPLVALAAALILAFARGAGGDGLAASLGVYLGWALIQQYVVAVLIRGRLEPACGALSSVLAAGAFGFLHFPNFALMGATFVLGLYLMEVFRRHGGLLAIACAHALLAVGINLAAPRYLWLSREVGPAFLAGL